MSIVIGSMILCVIGTFILMWICSMLMGDDGLYVACFLFVALMFALLVSASSARRSLVMPRLWRKARMRAPMAA